MPGAQLPPPDRLLDGYRGLVHARRLNEQAGALVRQGRLAVYPSSRGQEACQVAAAMVLADGQHDGKQLIDPEALLPAITPQVVSSRGDQPAARSGFYGYGFNVGTTSGARTELSHSGAFELGANSNFVILPSADVGIVVLTNATPIGVPEALTASFADLVQFGDVRQDWFALYSGLYKQMEKCTQMLKVCYHILRQEQ